MRLLAPIHRARRTVRAHPRAAAGVIAALLLVAVLVGVVAVRPTRATAPIAPALSPVRTVSGPAERPTRVVSFADGCTTSNCHTALATAPALHATTARGACDACHLPDAGDHTFPLVRARTDLCTACHNTGTRQAFQHGAMTGDTCLACHDPHAGNSRALLAADTTEAMCSACHVRNDARNAHMPYASGACTECHDPHGADNPHLLLGGAGPDHCARCHAPITLAVRTAAHTHGAVEGSCAACHEHHASNSPQLLHAQPRDLCIGCHGDIAAALSEAVVSHDPVLKGRQCVTCHDPHASDNRKMLREDQPTICLDCHDEPVVAADGRTIPSMAASLASSPVVHGAVAHGDCSACHSVHGSTHQRLLQRINPSLLTGPFDLRNYALCFACHDPGLAISSAATAFRDGSRNLHRVHLGDGSKSRGCSACHAVHAGELPRLIASTVDFEGSGWLSPMNFTITPDGGSCAPGCHEPMSYSRAPRTVPPVQKGAER